MTEKYNEKESIKKVEEIRGKTLDDILKGASKTAGADIAKVVFKHFGLEMPSGVEAMFLEKGKRIEQNITRKENSITEAAIRRDAVIFVNCEVELIKTFDNQMIGNYEDKLKQLHEKWIKYFQKVYNSNGDQNNEN